MEERYQLFRKWLKKCDKPSLRKLCCLAGLDDDETKLIVMFYSEKKDEYFIADFYSKSIDTIHRWKMNAMEKLRTWCRMHTGGTASPETLDILEKLLSPKKSCCLCHDSCPYYGCECNPASTWPSSQGA